MKFIIAFLFSLPFISVVAQPVPLSNETHQMLITGVNIIPMDNNKVLQNYDVLVHKGKIIRIGKTGKVRHFKTAVIINAKGKYLLPGLAELHAHVPPTDNEEAIIETMNLFMLHGITSIRGMLGHPKHLIVRAKILNGEFPAPRFFTSGPSFNGNSVKSPQEGMEMVRLQKQEGYDFLKLHPGLSREIFDSIAMQAVQLAIPFAGHVSFDVGIWRAIEARYATIDHLDGFIEGITPGIQNITAAEAGFFGINLTDKADTTQFQRLMKELWQNRVWVVPTQALAERWMSPLVTTEELLLAEGMQYISEEVKRQWANAKNNFINNPNFDSAQAVRYLHLRRRLIQLCQENGVGLLLGSDAPQVFNVPGISTHQELEYLVQSGLTEYQALQSGTINAGLFFKRKTGIIKPGYLSDFIIVSGNPLEDISNTRNIEGIMQGNFYIDKNYRDAILKTLEK